MRCTHFRAAVVVASTILSAFLGSTSLAQIPLNDGEAEIDFINQGEWHYYYIDVQDWHAQTGFAMKELGSGNPDLYVRKDALPTLNDWDYRPYTNSLWEVVWANSTSNPPLESGRYFLGVHGRQAGRYGVGARRDVLPSAQGGMGSIPYNDGVAFRVWAPNADSVHVAGFFNGWSTTSTPLADEGNGNFSVDYRNIGPGEEYKYVIRNGQSVIWKIDSRAREVVNSVGNTIVADPEFPWTDGDFIAPAWNETVIYEMHIGTFNDSPGGLPGDFDDAVGRLDHLQALGINAIEVMPTQEFPGDFSWGYNLSQPFAVESVYGGPQALKNFVNEAHARGIAVMHDVVYNHWGPSDLELWQYDGWAPNNMGGIFFYNDFRSQTPWGDTRPDFGRGEVRQYIRDNALMWLQDYHMDGLRVDGTQFIRTTNGQGSTEIPEGWSLMQWINDDIDQVQPWTLIVAEDMANNSALTQDSNSGGAGFDSQWSAQFVHPVRGNLIAPLDSSRDMWAVKSAIEQRYSADAFERVIFTESHDEVANGKSRLPEEIWPGNAGSYESRKRSTLGAVMVMTSPGIPMIFQGQEILEDEYFRDTDPVDWSKLTTYAGINQLYTDLIRLRRNWYNTTAGLRGQSLNFHHVNNNDKVIAYHRWDGGGGGDDVVIVLNLSSQTWNSYNIGFPRGGTWNVRLNTDSVLYSSDYGNFGSLSVNATVGAKDGMNFNGDLSIAPYSALILSQD